MLRFIGCSLKYRTGPSLRGPVTEVKVCHEISCDGAAGAGLSKFSSYLSLFSPIVTLDKFWESPRSLGNYQNFDKLKTTRHFFEFIVKKALHTELLPFEAEEVVTSLGETVALARRARDWTQSDLASKMGASVNTVVNIEKGRPSVGFGQVLNALWVLDLLGGLRDAVRPEDVPEIKRAAMKRLKRSVRGAHG
ncbi:helix-turn-helix domain-containing protein [Burkholderia ubonensis]|uniref:helix-turn-helix domain-containing protein n=1 Tax=Burkholderia ubonensis TaxID=101571 RepID=UPI001E58F003|nr:helix-turn-helix domain-containing protein [Burkholderia ubonensis]